MSSLSSVFSAVASRETVIIAVLLFGAANHCYPQASFSDRQPSQLGTGSIELQTIATLGSSSDPGSVGPLAYVAATKVGYFVSSASLAGEIFVYSSDGEFLKTIGRRGPGPGEFEGAVIMEGGPADSLHVIDPRGMRYHVFAPDMSFVRQEKIPVPIYEFALQNDGGIFASAPRVENTTPTPTALMELDRTGSIIQVFDTAEGLLRDPMSHLRHVAVAPSGRRWSISTVHYHIVGWSTSNEKDIEIGFDPDWLLESELPEAIDPDRTPPPARIAGLNLDNDHRLWVFSFLPAEGKGLPSNGQTVDPLTMYDTLIEVVDPSSSRIIARRRVAGMLFPLDRNRAFRVVESQELDYRVEVNQIYFSPN